MKKSSLRHNNERWASWLVQKEKTLLIENDEGMEQMVR